VAHIDLHRYLHPLNRVLATKSIYIRASPCLSACITSSDAIIRVRQSWDTRAQSPGHFPWLHLSSIPGTHIRRGNPPQIHRRKRHQRCASSRHRLNSSVRSFCEHLTTTSCTLSAQNISHTIRFVSRHTCTSPIMTPRTLVPFSSVSLQLSLLLFTVTKHPYYSSHN